MEYYFKGTVMKLMVSGKNPPEKKPPVSGQG